MSGKDSSVFFSNSLQEALASLKNIPGIRPVGGCLGFIYGNLDRVLHLPERLLTLNGIPELTAINKTERHIEFGAAVTIRSILNLGEKNIPPVLYRALKSIGNPSVRALATIGGNLAPVHFHYAASAPLLALDAKLEIRQGTETRMVSLNHYFSAAHGSASEESRTPELITKVRVPTDGWDVSIFCRTGKPGMITEDTGFFVFLVKTQKNILSDLRVAWASDCFFRNREFENLTIGKTLPLSEREIDSLLNRAGEYTAAELPAGSYKHRCFFNYLESAFRVLS